MKLKFVCDAKAFCHKLMQLTAKIPKVGRDKRIKLCMAKLEVVQVRVTKVNGIIKARLVELALGQATTGA